MHQIRDELRMKYFDRKHIAKAFNNQISFLYLLFINDFEIHRNIYRILKTFYFISIYLSYEKRRKIINIFTLILNSHDVNLKTIMKIFIDLKKIMLIKY